MPKELSAPLDELIRSLTQVPAELHKCRSLYEVIRASRELPWVRPLRRFSAVSTWVTCALVADDRCRKHMTKLVVNEAAGERWIQQIATAVHPVLDELDRLDGSRARRTTKDRTRAFLQHRDRAVRALNEARTHLAAIGCRPSLEELIKHADYQLLYDTVAELTYDHHRRHQFRIDLARQKLVDEGVQAKQQWAEFINEGEFFEAALTPDIDFLLHQTITLAAAQEAPEVDRHSVRGRFLRALYQVLEGTPIGNVRIAFLQHATQAVFSEEVDKAQVRRLVKDVAEEASARNEWLEEIGLGGEWAESFLRQAKGDSSLQRGGNLRRSPGGLSAQETFEQSRRGSGRGKKAQDESAEITAARRSGRTATPKEPSAIARGPSADRKKP